MTYKMDYFNIKAIDQLYQQNGKKYKKHGLIQARKIKPTEIGQSLFTYIVNDNDTVQLETTNTLTENTIVVRNAVPLKKLCGEIIVDALTKIPIHNEYAMLSATFEKNYGSIDELTTNYDKTFEKKLIIEALPISPDVFEILQQHSPTQNNCLVFTDWGLEKAEVGGLLTKNNYVISKRNSLTDYVEID